MHRVIGVLLGFLLLAGACGDDSDSASTPTTDEQNAEDTLEDSGGLDDEAVLAIESGILGLVGDTFPDLLGQVASVQLEGSDLTVEISNLDDAAIATEVCITVSDFAESEGVEDVTTTIETTGVVETLAETSSDGACVPA